MTRLAQRLAADGWTCRSGGARGADQAFMRGAGEQVELYLPWPRFNDLEHIKRVKLTSPTLEAYDIARMLHPAWKHLDWNARAAWAERAPGPWRPVHGTSGHARVLDTGWCH